MNDKHFTHDEVSLMSIYNADGTREGLIADLTEMRADIFIPLLRLQPADLPKSASFHCFSAFHALMRLCSFR